MSTINSSRPIVQMALNRVFSNGISAYKENQTLTDTKLKEGSILRNKQTGQVVRVLRLCTPMNLGSSSTRITCVEVEDVLSHKEKLIADFELRSWTIETERAIESYKKAPEPKPKFKKGERVIVRTKFGEKKAKITSIEKSYSGKFIYNYERDDGTPGFTGDDDIRKM